MAKFEYCAVVLTTDGKKISRGTTNAIDEGTAGLKVQKKVAKSYKVTEERVLQVSVFEVN
jgi:hypothetical protein